MVSDVPPQVLLRRISPNPYTYLRGAMLLSVTPDASARTGGTSGSSGISGRIAPWKTDA
jgi:hypothetical protein